MHGVPLVTALMIVFLFDLVFDTGRQFRFMYDIDVFFALRHLLLSRVVL